MTLPRSGSGYGNGASNRSSPRTPGGARSQSWEDLALFPLTGGRSSAVSLGCNASSAASPAGGNARTASGSASSPWPSLSSGLMLYSDRLKSRQTHILTWNPEIGWQHSHNQNAHKETIELIKYYVNKFFIILEFKQSTQQKLILLLCTDNVAPLSLTQIRAHILRT